MNLPKFHKIPCTMCNQTGIEYLYADTEVTCKRCHGGGYLMGDLIQEEYNTPLEQKVCQWSNFMDRIDDASIPSQNCSNIATHTTCDPKGNVVCESHKCRCSKPLHVKGA